MVFLPGIRLFRSFAPGREGGTRVTAVKTDAFPQIAWQKTAAFPDWKGYTDDTLAMNGMVSFRFFHGQGTIWLDVPDTVERYTLYVNGAKYDTEGLTGGVWRMDISGDTVDGTNTLAISNVFPLGLARAITAYIPYPSVLDGPDGTEGIRPEALEMIGGIIESDVRHGFPSAQLAVVRNGRLVFSGAWGTVNAFHPDGSPKTDSAPVTAGTLYDLASVTKMFSVNYAVQKLVTDGALDIDRRIVDVLGDGFAADTLDFAYADAETPADHETQLAWKRALTVRDVLRHQAGFPAGPHYNEPDYDMSLQAAGAKNANLCYAAARRDTLTAIFRTPLLYEPGTKTVYSDVDYILLTFVVEAITGRRLDSYMQEVFFEPLGLTRITFLPLERGFEPDDCAATELNGNTRDGNVFFEGVRMGTLQGEVHDERAWHCMEGVSGHAGLFANAEDLAKLAGVCLRGDTENTASSPAT